MVLLKIAVAQLRMWICDLSYLQIASLDGGLGIAAYMFYQTRSDEYSKWVSLHFHMMQIDPGLRGEEIVEGWSSCCLKCWNR